jgi:cytochrome c-type biogenesis protein CcmF
MPSFVSSLFGATFPLFGFTLILGVMLVASYTFCVSLVAGSNGKPRSLQAARFGAYATVALIAACVFALAYAFQSHDFRIRYVAHYSDRSMPWWFLLTALWGGQDGSLLWWLFLLSIYIGLCVRWMGRKFLALQPYVIATLMGIVLFFCILMAFAANPFAESVAGARIDGEGLNPLLQNFYMIIHPPSLYTGFVGCSIPFAFAVAALVTGRLDQEWIVASRKWMLFAWMFLAIGNTLGMLWAYEELGWGGYWAWDPVENAAFMPFISATAFVHSVMIQERRGMLKVWTVFLICFTFFMTIFGTFLTRSGAIASVHSFAQSSIGTYFVYFLLLLGAFAATLVFYRWPELRDLPATPRLRRAALVTGWVALVGTAPGIAILLGRGGFSTTMRVVTFIALESAVVYIAIEVVYRMMTKSLDMRAKRPRLESVLSREFTFLLNNWILMGLLGFILVATTFPMITEALLNEKVSVGPPFYNAWVQPLGLLLIFLMGVGTLFGWRKTSKAALKRALIAPVAVFVGVAVLHFAFGSMIGFPAIVWGDAIYDGALGSGLRAFNAITPVLGIALCAFNATITVQEFVALLAARRRSLAEKVPAVAWWARAIASLPYTILTLAPSSRRRYGGYIVHLGIVIMFLGFTGKSWNIDKETTLNPGQSYEVAGYTMQYLGSRMEVDNTKRMIFADVRVTKHGVSVGTATPAKFIYKKMPESPTTEVAMLHTLRDDVYLVVGTINPNEGNRASIQIHINPLVTFVWFGCIVLILGSIVCMWPELQPSESRVWQFARGGAGIAASIFVGLFIAMTPALAHAQTGPMPHSGTVHLQNDGERALFSKMRCMCGGCARDLLSTCPCSQAEDARDQIRDELAAGKTEQQVLDAYVGEWGEASLAVPPNRGALRSVYLIPIAALLAGAVGLAFAVRRWRKGGDDDPPLPPAKGGSGDAYDARLDDELKDLDA